MYIIKHNLLLYTAKITVFTFLESKFIDSLKN